VPGFRPVVVLKPRFHRKELDALGEDGLQGAVSIDPSGSMKSRLDLIVFEVV
jgi:hypothetical protein